MPELPEVETMVRGIRSAAEHRVIETIEFVQGTCRPISVTPSAREFARFVAGATVERVHRLAKRIVMDLSTGSSIVIEPRMTGLMLIAEPPTDVHRRVVWRFRRKRGQPDSIEFWDRRGLGTVRLLTGREVGNLRDRLGTDALNMSDDEWFEKLRSTDRAVKVALLDQHLVAGIGNLYASEILHEARVSPRRQSSSLSATEMQGIATATRRILDKAIAHEGSTLGDGTYRNALNQDGSFQNHHRVYQRHGLLCVTCKTASIQRIVQSQRATFFCPKCQPMSGSHRGVRLR